VRRLFAFFGGFECNRDLSPTNRVFHLLCELTSEGFYGPETTVKVTLFGLYAISKCSLLLISRPLTVEN
jgi:hypothetical protein